ncbi:two-component system, response regulator YesN [Paenibacillus catalpae]|uniref:Two-component system, response regulator YesN n=1 Tax=Paenibacillus catalpae TaxID=1045775 RepID=A0A1I2DC35_9BACL|nr:response regulator [Paenibacillus catalpae]SFE78074.1 two-component system, response regulator YesN [Paenibacillus catalpae]
MLSIMIIDDEDLIRRGLEKIISKLNEEYVVVGSFSNGFEASQELDRLAPDVVITDIKMPYMDGLQFIEELRRRLPDTRCLILSGYNDFDYARTAMQYGVKDYLIKPVDKEELVANLAQIHEEIKAAKQEKVKEQLLSKKAQMSDLLLREQQLRRLLGGDKDAPIAVESESLSMPLLFEQYYAVLAVRASNQGMKEQLLEWGRTKASTGLESVAMESQIIALLVPSPKEEETGRLAHKTALCLMNDLQFAAKGKFVIGIGGTFKGSDAAAAAYQEALALSYAGIYKREAFAIVTGKEGPNTPADPAFFTALMEGEFSRALERLDADGIGTAVQHMFVEIERVRPSYADLVQFMANLLYTAVQKVDGLLDELVKLTPPGVGVYQSVADFFNLTEMKERILHLLELSLYRLASVRKEGNRVIETVKQLIQQDYDKELELTELSEKVFLNPSYLSTLFKQEMGQTITQYVLQLRMMKAKELLKKRLDLKVYEVGEQVGYPDSIYFNKVFKKMVGVTPKEYRNL